MDIFFFIGTVSFTLTGYLLGVRKRFDWLGVAILALLTAVGGGMLRDMLIQRTPRILYQNDTLWVIAATLALAWGLRLQTRRAPQLERLFILADSIGLVAFSIGGAQIGAMLGAVKRIGHGLVNRYGDRFCGWVRRIPCMHCQRFDLHGVTLRFWMKLHSKIRVMFMCNPLN